MEHSRLYSQESWLSDPRRFHDPKGHENVSLPHRLVECQARPEKGEYGRYALAQVESYARVNVASGELICNKYFKAVLLDGGNY